jgi:hypothetical protein
VTDEYGPAQVMCVEDGQQVADVGVEAVGAGQFATLPPAPEVDRQQPGLPREGPADHPPRLAIAGDPVHRYDRRSVAVAVAEPVHGQLTAVYWDLKPRR